MFVTKEGKALTKPKKEPKTGTWAFFLLIVFSNFDCVNVDVRIDTHTRIGINMLDISTLQKQDCKIPGSFESATSTATSLLREPNITCSDLN